nr:hypothetical protein CFP56_79587 [Quercus suber]
MLWSPRVTTSSSHVRFAENRLKQDLMAEVTKDQSGVKDEEKSEDPAWEGSQYETALAHFERLQHQIDNLRSTIPSIISPLLRPSPTKAQMFADIKKSAVQATDDVKGFRESWMGDQTQDLLRRATVSLEGDGDLEAASGVQRYGWVDREEDAKGSSPN